MPATNLDSPKKTKKQSVPQGTAETKKQNLTAIEKVGKTAKQTFHWFVYSLPTMEWTKLLAMPLVIATATSIITGQIQKEANNNAVLKSYFEELENLVFEHNLLPEDNQPSNESSVIIARGKTLVTLRTLDLPRRRQLIAFLQASNITKSTKTFRTSDERPVLSFEGQDLSGLDLRKTNLTRMDFYKTNLENANFNGAHMYGAFMYAAKLSEASLRKTDLKKARLEKADLSNTDLRDADLSGARLSRADLRGTDLSNANLSGTDLSNADLSGANLKNADLSDAILAGTNFQNAKFLNMGTNNEKRPYLCNPGFLPTDQVETQGLNTNQDCDVLPQIMTEEHTTTWEELEEAEQAIDDIRNKQWHAQN